MLHLSLPKLRYLRFEGGFLWSDADDVLGRLLTIAPNLSHLHFIFTPQHDSSPIRPAQPADLPRCERLKRILFFLGTEGSSERNRNALAVRAFTAVMDRSPRAEHVCIPVGRFIPDQVDNMLSSLTRLPCLSNLCWTIHARAFSDMFVMQGHPFESLQRLVLCAETWFDQVSMPKQSEA